jgi:hypothetical protein
MFTVRFDPDVRTFLDEARVFDAAGARVAMLTPAFLGGPFAESPWRRERGALLDVGPHVIDLTTAALGPVSRVQVGMVATRQGLEGGVDDVLVRVGADGQWWEISESRYDFMGFTANPAQEGVFLTSGHPGPGSRTPNPIGVMESRDGGVTWESVSLRGEDVIVVFGHRSDTEFYYAHLSSDNTIYPHNGIFVVNNADRLRIDDQWNGTDLGAPPAITDTDWHDVRLDYDADTGHVAVYVDGSREPLMTATDTSFAGGRVAFGSFDNYGRVRDVFVAGQRAD